MQVQKGRRASLSPHPKAPKGKEGRNGEDRKGRRDPLDPLAWGRQNVCIGVERGGDYHMGLMIVQREASKSWIEPPQCVHNP